MPPRPLLVASLLAAATVFAILFLWQPWDSDGADHTVDEPGMTVERVISLVSQEHTGCPEQPLLVLTADASYDGDGRWTVTYGDYSWAVDEADGAVRALGDQLPCPQR